MSVRWRACRERLLKFRGVDINTDIGGEEADLHAGDTTLGAKRLVGLHVVDSSLQVKQQTLSRLSLLRFV
jgi:hypothetical protein